MRLQQGLAGYCKAETTFTFHFSILTLSNAFLGIDNREMKSESGFSFAIASQPFHPEDGLVSQRDRLQPFFTLGPSLPRLYHWARIQFWGVLNIWLCASSAQLG